MSALTHASFFSGVGGLDLGFERAGWRTVSFSEIDPYASAVLAERWPGVPNLGDIIGLDGRERERASGDPAGLRPRLAGPAHEHQRGDWRTATLWSGGFPCQDLSVAGKRAGFAGARSSLAFAFLDLVEQHRPPLILLENVPGLLSSHRGRDMAALLGRLAELGYGVGYRILDARHFGVPQRRRRVFIVAVTPGGRAGAERAAEVLSVGSRCHRHPAAGVEAGEGAAYGVGNGPLSVGGHVGIQPNGQDAYTGQLIADSISPPPDPGGVRAPDGLAGRVDDLAPTLRVGPARPQDGGPGDTVPIVVGGRGGRSVPNLLPLGLDSHRYRCCGNGVVSSVAEWIGLRLAALA